MRVTKTPVMDTIIPVITEDDGDISIASNSGAFASAGSGGAFASAG